MRLAAMGNHLAASMIATERKSEATLTLILRGVGTLAMIVGFAMLLGPLSTMASVIPLLGSIVRGAAFFSAATVGIPLSLVVIALACIWHRPAIGGRILLVALAAFYGLADACHTAARSKGRIAVPGQRSGRLSILEYDPCCASAWAIVRASLKQLEKI